MLSFTCRRSYSFFTFDLAILATRKASIISRIRLIDFKGPAA